MNNQWLETFICVSNTQSVGKAAQLLFLSQPSISSRIKALETEVGEPLFMRVGKKMILNETGKAFLPFAIKILSEWNQSREAIRDLKDTVKGTLSIALFYAVIPIFTPHFITFKQKYPEVKLSIRIVVSDEISSYIKSNMVQVGIVREMEEPLFNCQSILNDDFLLVTHPQHRLAKQQQFSFKDLEQEDFIFLNSGSVFSEIVNNYMQPKVLESQVILDTNNVEVCKQFILANYGIAFMPRFSVKNELDEGTLCALELEDLKNVNKSIDLIWMKEHSNYVVSVFVNHILAQFRE